MLSPATRARNLLGVQSTRGGADPGLADSPWALCCRPLRGLRNRQLLVSVEHAVLVAVYADADA